MVRVSKFLLYIGLVSVCASGVRAQRSSKIVSIPNLSGSPISVTSIWVSDSSNFVIKPLTSYPISVSEAGTIDASVSIKQHDGATRTTEVWYRDAQGNEESYMITMTAPQSLSEHSQIQPERGDPVYPNPAKDVCTVDVDIRLYPNVQVDLYNGSGARAIGIVKPSADKLIVDTRNLADGKYNIVVTSNGAIVKSEEVVVRH